MRPVRDESSDAIAATQRIKGQLAINLAEA